MPARLHSFPTCTASGASLAVNAAPLATLQISPELAEAAAGADLVVLEGMGRSIETNLNARFRCVWGGSGEKARCVRGAAGLAYRLTSAAPAPACSCDAINLGMIKHPEVAAALHARLFDCVCKFQPAPGDT